MKDTYIYPAIFHLEEDNSYWVEFPDFPMANTQGENLEDALYMAKDCLELYLDGLENIPTPKEVKKLKKNETLIMIEANMLEYKKRNQNKSVSTTVTLPKWLKDTAIEKKINLSSILKSALLKELDL